MARSRLLPCGRRSCRCQRCKNSPSPPQKKDWVGNEPERLAKVLAVYEKLSAETNVSIADLIALGGTVAVEKAIKDAGFNVPLQFNAGRGDAVQEMTDAKSF